jgi:hypothetical protein
MVAKTKQNKRIKEGSNRIEQEIRWVIAVRVGIRVPKDKVPREKRKKKDTKKSETLMRTKLERRARKNEAREV